MRKIIAFYALVLALAFNCPGAVANIRLPQLISDGMVLQRDATIKVWGWATPGEKVNIQIAGQHGSAITTADGKWLIRLKPVKAGGPYLMDISGADHIVLKNILFGDVWFCAGQSNMVLQMERVKEHYPDEIANANFPQIRNFFVPTLSDVKQIHEDLPPGKWLEANPQNVLDFGAASYFFAKKLYLKYHIPIGIINSSVGGTPIQAWISEDGFSSLPKYAGRIAQFKDTAFMNSLMRPAKVSNAPKRRTGQTDKGLTGPLKWYDNNYMPDGWHKFWLPGYWADQGVRGLNGIVWFRKTIEVPAAMAGKPAKLFLGRIVDADETYVNGQKVGNITYQYPPRRYDVPAGLLKAGANIITVRITNTLGKGGFVPDKRYELTNGERSIDLRGDWLYQVGQVFTPMQPGMGGAPPFVAQNEPAGLYNTMVAPAINYTVKGFTWYQGESNSGMAAEYNKLLPALINDWRIKWGSDKLPFVCVQLPNFNEVQYTPGESQWAELREAELNAMTLPYTALAVTLDAGEWNDIHPVNKKDVGERMALAAQKIAYGDQGVTSGPICTSAQVDKGQIILSFAGTGSGLMAKGGGELNQFAIAGDNKKFVWAKATIAGDKVIVSSEDVPDPKYVRYAWADNPEGANLYNQEGLPASPFRTDSKP